MGVVITGIGITSAVGSEILDIYKNMSTQNSYIEDIDYFDTTKFQSSKGGSIPHDIWKKIVKMSLKNEIDLCTSLSIYSIEKALKDSAIENYECASLAFGTCNGGINSLKNFVENREENTKIENYCFSKIAKDIKKYFGLKGKDFTFNTACSASGNAIAYASDMIRNGKARVVIAGGSDPMSDYVFAGFNALKAMNKEITTPYGEDIGLNLGEGAAFFILETKESALKREAKIYAEILGYGLSNDCYHSTAPDKNGNGIRKAITDCLKNSGLNKEDIDYINSHGTGTNANDISELNGIKSVFKGKLPLISSLKGYFGHNLGAAASIELAVTLIGLKNNMIFPNLGIKNYRKGCDNKNIFLKKMIMNKNEIHFINNNAAFGGHNTAVAFKVLNHWKDDRKVFKKKIRKIYINSFGICDGKTFESVDKMGNLTENSTILKEYNYKYYERRMNYLSQISIIAADLAIEKEKKLGLVYGTTLGSMNSTKKYIDSILYKGLEHASSIYFPDLVLNSTAGKIAKVLKLYEYSSSISDLGFDDLKALEVGIDVIINGYQNNILVGTGYESSELANKILKHNTNKSNAAFVLLSSIKNKNSMELILYHMGNHDENNISKIIKSSICENSDINNIIIIREECKKFLDIQGKNIEIEILNENNYSVSIIKKIIEIFKIRIRTNVYVVDSEFNVDKIIIK